MGHPCTTVVKRTEGQIQQRFLVLSSETTIGDERVSKSGHNRCHLETRLQDWPPGMLLHDGRRGSHVAIRNLGSAVDSAVNCRSENLLRHIRRRGRVQPHVPEDDLDVAVDLGLWEAEM